jgi:hypothetical protein
MLRSRRSAVLAVWLVVVLVVGLVPTLLLAQDEDTDFGQAPAGEVPPEVDQDVFPPGSNIDGFEELNPVSEETLEDLAAQASAEALTVDLDSSDGLRSASSSATAVFTITSVFQKYAFLPFCTTTGCAGGIDHMAAGTGLRNTGYGTIRMRGIPPTATAVSAFLYVGIIDSTVPPPNPLIVNFNGTNVRAFLVNTAPSPCWGAGTFRAYRAPVLPLLAAPINADYPVSRVPSSVTNGQCPWAGALPNPRAEGASLVVLYTDRSVPRGTRTQIHHPIVTSVFGTTTYNHFLTFPINFGAVKHTRLGADGQTGVACPGVVTVGTNERTFIGGPVFTPLVQIRGNPGGANLDSDWNGTDGEPLNQLWDTHTSPVAGTIAPGPFVANYRVQYQSPIDCIIPVAHVLTYR